jgi:predicted choloylglycine hydrolase
MNAMNADGLILGQNDVGQAADGSPPLDLRNTPTAVLARRILEECATLDEAKKLLDTNKPASRSIFIACDRRGGGAFEITPKTVVLRRGEFCIATNHFQSKELSPSRTDCPRAFVLAQASGLEKLGIEDVTKKMQEVHQGARTAHSIVFEPKSLKLRVAFGDGDKPATQYPFKEIDLSKMLRP